MNLCRLALGLAQFFDIEVWPLSCGDNDRLAPCELLRRCLDLTHQIRRNDHRTVLIRVNNVAVGHPHT